MKFIKQLISLIVAVIIFGAIPLCAAAFLGFVLRGMLVAFHFGWNFINWK